MNRPFASRREFLRRAASFAATAFPMFLLHDRAAAVQQGTLVSTDETIILKQLGRGTDEDLFRLPMGDLVAEMGRSFLERPYEANTLEEQGEEHLVVNLRSFDCVTLCETSLALARAVKLHAGSTRGYCAQLQLIRYRSGVINGYASRLHYFSEWIADNERKKVLRNISRELGGRRDRRALNFMSSHRGAYPRLASDGDFAAVTAAEKALLATPRYFVPKEKVEGVLERIQNGDILAITTSVGGLDVSHTGIAVRDGGTTRLLHAPIVGQQVQITRGSLSEYLNAHEKQTGIMVVRPLEPAT
ncbi:MAG TPA: N-acetylmuramoyl-L-alanine amidase-like domain-containing protein [Bacteroidota bacterium]